MAENRVSGYHGTIQIRANAILKEKKFHPSSKDTEWLGRGIYFFPYVWHAKKWAEQESRRTHKTNRFAVVLKASLLYGNSQMCDLDDPDMLSRVNEFVAATIQKSGITVNFSTLEKRKKWCLACNIYRKYHPEIAITSYTFIVNVKRDTYIGLRETQRQLCVSDDTIIHDIQRLEA